MNPIIIDNFLEEGYFNELTNLICNTKFDSMFSWFYGEYADPQTRGHETLITNYFFTHVFYVNGLQYSKHMELLMHFLEKIKTLEGTPEEKQHVKKLETNWRLQGGLIKSILRMRANLFVNTREVYQYPMHTDYEFSHTAAVLSLNTCDGYTGIEDEDGQITKVDSVANRVVLYDAGKNHCSSTTSDANARFNIIVNFL